jgi:hypothetical protein
MTVYRSLRLPVSPLVCQEGVLINSSFFFFFLFVKHTASVGATGILLHNVIFFSHVEWHWKFRRGLVVFARPGFRTGFEGRLVTHIVALFR